MNDKEKAELARNLQVAADKLGRSFMRQLSNELREKRRLEAEKEKARRAISPRNSKKRSFEYQR